MNRKKLAILVAVCFTVSTTIVPVNATTEQLKSQTEVTQKDNLSLNAYSDTLDPTLSNVKIVSSSNSSTTQIGDTITLKFTSSELLKNNPAITILGNAIKESDVTSIGNDYTATYVIAPTTHEGPVTFTISDVIDMASNHMATNVSKITTGTDINVTKQVLSEVTMLSDNANKDYANSGNTVTLKFTSFHTLAKTPVVNINGVAIKPISLAPNTYTATYSLKKAKTEGYIPFSINNLEDVSGVKSTKSITTVTSGNGVTFYNAPPTVSDVYIDSGSSDKSAKSGSTIHLNFTTNKPLSTLNSQAPIIKIFNKIVIPQLITNVGLKYTASYVLKDIDPEGYINFEISNLTNLAGDVNKDIINTVPVDKNIKYDKTPTAINNVTFTSNNPIPTLAKPEDKLSLEFDTDGTEFVATNVIIAGHKVTAVKTPNTNHYKAEYTLDDTTLDGQIIYDFNGILDEAGNVALPTNPIDSSVIFDKTAPTFTNISLKSTNSSGIDTDYPNVSDIVNLTFSSSEKLKENQFVEINGHDCNVNLILGDRYSASYRLTQNDADANITFKISSLLDIAGNKSTTYDTIEDGDPLILDKIAPTITIGGVINNEITNDASTDALITFYDENFDLDSNITTINGIDVSKSIKKTGDGLYSYNFHATEEGKYVVKAYGKDLSQNETTKTLTFTIDRTIPVVSFNVNSPYVNKAFTPIITTGSPEDVVIEVLINGSSVNPKNLPTLYKNQKYVLEAISMDLAGNVSKTTTSTFILDTIRPQINVSGLIQSFFYATDVNPNITFADVNLLNYTMTLNGAKYTNKEITKDGVYDLKIFSKDKAGNISEQLIHFVIDKSSPTIEFKYPLNNKTFNKIIKPLLITKSKYGLDSISMTLDGEIYHGEDITTEGKHTIIVTAKNKSGKVTKKSFTFFIKTTPPIIRITNVKDGKTYKSGIIPEIYKEEAIKYEMTLNGKPYIYGLAINDAGPYTLVIKATDTADNVATKTIHFSIENKTLVGALKAINPLTENKRSSLPVVGGLIALCTAGIFGFFRFKSRKKTVAK
ncbi:MULTISPECIES: Ig-like domain-containing protein [Clostridium]|uniref:Ig-like domain (Group 3) n=1 Tax=Clostridium frigoriphilum TaxID=443253 RepID=A0ABU7USY3_9CLOT|nr:hypothetical protein [Clostridium sp. DSM 17811]MBU3101263.1 hypothetical protein [Clostridium sp. DSM 17811]